MSDVSLQPYSIALGLVPCAVDWWLPGAAGRKEWGVMFMDSEFQFGENEDILQINGGEACTM